MGFEGGGTITCSFRNRVVIGPVRTRGLSSTEAFEGLPPGGCMYPGLPELPGELGSMPSLFRRMPAGAVRARSDLITTEIVFPSGTRIRVRGPKMTKEERMRERARAIRVVRGGSSMTTRVPLYIYLRYARRLRRLASRARVSAPCGLAKGPPPRGLRADAGRSREPSCHLHLVPSGRAETGLCLALIELTRRIPGASACSSSSRSRLSS